MTPEAPEFHTKPLSPLSPLPVYPPEPSKIPVLQNQIDPIFNMTSTHLETEPTNPAVVAATNPHSEPNLEPADAEQNSPSADSNFSDAYKEEPQESRTETKSQDDEQGSEASDDYGMAFDSDKEENADNQDVTQPISQPDSHVLPESQSQIAVPSLPTSIDASPTSVSQAGQSIQSTLTSPPKLDDVAAAIQDIKAEENFDTTNPNTQAQTYEDIASGGIDIQQLLDNITANAEKKESAAVAEDPSTNAPTPVLKATSGLPTHSSLPPRPNIPQKRQYEDIQTFHPGVKGLPPASSSYRPPGVIIAAGAPGTYTDPRGGLPPPPSASFQPPSLPTASPISQASFGQNNRSSMQGHQTRSISSQDEADAELDAKWGPEIQKIYDKFLDDERMYVTEGLWDRFPNGSRLFIGNLPSEKVTKRDIFHVFHPYGKIAQISIKNAYGFVQFHDTSACYTALDREQGAEVRGKRIHLEISKPQKNTRKADPATSGRSRSPDHHNRGDMGTRGGRGRNGDRYDARPSPQMRQDEYGRPLRVRDDYRPGSGPVRSPPRHSRDDYTSRGRDQYGGRDRRRSRSPSPNGYRDGRYRERSLSPRLREANEDADLQIPRRDPRNIPDVQIILMDQLDRQFVSWVENEMRGRGIKVEVMFLNPRLPLQAVIRRQILEGVHAVSKLDMRSQNTSKIPLQVFDRQAGANNIRFDEYQDLDPKIAAELVLRAKQTQVPAQQPQPTYQAPQYGAPQSYAPQPAVPAPQSYQQPAAPVINTQNLASMVGQLDNATLQKLLGSLNPQAQNAPAAAANSAIDLAGILGGLMPQQSQQGYQQPADPYANSQAQNYNQPQAAQPAPQQSAQQVQNIMAQLARYRQ